MPQRHIFSLTTTFLSMMTPRSTLLFTSIAGDFHPFPSGSLPHSPLLTHMAHHIRLPSGPQEAGVQDQPEMADLTAHPHPT